MAMTRDELLKLYDGLRVTDVCDGMDSVGLQDVGCVDSNIKALWKDFENFDHRIYGFAKTVRYMPTNRPRLQIKECKDEHNEDVGYWYNTYASDRDWVDTIQKGDIIVFDGSGITNTGFIGSENGYSWVNAGASGMITNAGCRDTDEIAKQRLPVYSAYISRGRRPSRLEFVDCNVTVEIGGVMVRPGDLIVADGDGVIVVPIEVAEEVGKFAKSVQDGDKIARRKHYEASGAEPDFTVM